MNLTTFNSRMFIKRCCKESENIHQKLEEDIYNKYIPMAEIS